MLQYGAQPDAAAPCTAAIQRAIDATGGGGGGLVTFPKGTFLTGALFLKANVELRLAAGVVLRAVRDDAAYPAIRSRIAGIEMGWPAAVINVYGQTNVIVSGRGTLDGSGDFWWKKFWGDDGKHGRLKDDASRGLRWAADYDCQRVRALLIYDSRNVTVSGITIERSGSWPLTATYSEKVKIDGVIIRAERTTKSGGSKCDIF